MTDKVQRIREEVEKIARSINPYIPDEEGKNSEYEAGRFAMVIQIMQIIDSLPEEPVSEDLEEAAKEYAESITNRVGYKLQLRRAICYGANWQKEQTINKACEWLDRTIRFYLVHEEMPFDDFIKKFKQAMEG